MRHLLLLALVLSGCNRFEATDRVAGERGPLTAPCESLDPVRCQLPWPSNTFTRVDASSETGLRVALDPEALPVDDRVDYANVADGFSRITGVVFGIEGAIDDAAISWDAADSLLPSSTLQVINAQPGDPDYGAHMAFRTESVDVSSVDVERHLVIGRPLQVLSANADHVAVLLDSVGGDGDAPRTVQVALGLVDPKNQEEAELAAYHAPTREVLEAAEVDLEQVLRVTEFTTRSHVNTTERLRAMMGLLDAASEDIGVEMDTVSFVSLPGVSVILRGRLTNAPNFLDEDGHLVLDEAGLPTVIGTTGIEFRMSIPSGEGGYHVALYGHGTGGDVSDNAFDDELGQQGISKLNLRFAGWTGDDLAGTLIGFSTFLEGSARSTAGLMQAMAGGSALLTALDGVLGEVVMGPTLNGQANPVAGRAPDTLDVAWVGGSMGGTMGAVIVSADPRLTTAVLNVPGAGWTHMIPDSLLFNSGMESIMLETYGTRLDLHVAMIMAQGSWDDIDGAVWAEEALSVGGAFLMQESMGDPILPNLGTDLLASALQATQLDPTLQDIHGLEHSDGIVTSGASLTQFRVPETGQYDVHGFAARDTPAAEAAMEQILELLTSAWQGSPEMSFPDGCTDVTDDGDCDFSGMWE